MKYSILCLWTVAVACTAVQSTAQSVDAEGVLATVDGHVRVNQGKMYVPASSGMPIVLNARVLVMENAKAVVRHADGCITELGSNTLFVLEHPSPCQGGVASIRTITPFKAAMPGAAGVPAAGVGFSIPVVAGVGGVVAAGAIAGGIAASSDDGGGGFVPVSLSPE